MCQSIVPFLPIITDGAFQPGLSAARSLDAKILSATAEFNALNGILNGGNAAPDTSAVFLLNWGIARGAFGGALSLVGIFFTPFARNNFFHQSNLCLA